MTYLTALNVFNTSWVERTGKLRAIASTGDRSLGSLVLWGALASLVASGCGEANGAGDETVQAEGSQPAVVVGNRICGPDECSMYLGAFPEVPGGELDRAKMREFGGVLYITVFEGGVYSYDRESARLSKFLITDDFLLEPAGELSFADLGAIGSPAWSRVVSPSRAFSFSFLSEAQTIVVWNPSTMAVDSEIQMSLT